MTEVGQTEAELGVRHGVRLSGLRQLVYDVVSLESPFFTEHEVSRLGDPSKAAISLLRNLRIRAPGQCQPRAHLICGTLFAMLTAAALRS